ncbi:MAG: DUF456 domain-containing protein [Vulcanibacillus sp.]
MDILIWVTIIFLFMSSFIGIVLPIIPGAPLIWLGVIIYYFGIEPIVGWGFWVSLILLTGLSFIIDYVASVSFVNKWGGSKVSKWAVIIGIILGPILLGPLGIIVGPFTLVVIAEAVNGATIRNSLKIGLASIVGLLGSSIIKGLIYILMITIFILKVLF